MKSSAMSPPEISGEPIARGSSCELYRMQNGRVLKLFQDHIPAFVVDIEKVKTEVVLQAGVDTLSVHTQVEHDGRHGLIFDQVDGPTILDELLRRPDDLVRLAAQFADAHTAVHACRTTNLPSLRDELQRTLLAVDHLSDAERVAVLERLASLDDGSAVCHGDFHPKNVILAEGKACVVDWLSATSGPPLADVAHTLLIVRHSKAAHFSPEDRSMIDSLREAFETAYRNAYVQRTGCSEAAIDQWYELLSKIMIAP
ncbi:MAG: phosphotransferase [Fuerstiella sp.]